MKTYLLEKTDHKADVLAKAFEPYRDVQVVCNTLRGFLSKVKVDCVVAPANGFGLMDGGYDAAIVEWYGEGIQKKVQKQIIKKYYGEQPVGTSMLVRTGCRPKYIIHTPTMRYPSVIEDWFVVYHCMRSTLICALKKRVSSLVIPAFGCGYGNVPPDVAANMMGRAYSQVMAPPKTLSWEYVEKLEANANNRYG